ncbi:TonB-dependent receptor [Luteimonas huabeiensis]|uniref:TonB-dependent receptor n=1 Tax=Luteimonas huabeiensis TaxID=1244513 RepID=UPI0004653B64|nr:TonB-dependent siderophore receptor [Luteimonas huabeiensis]
MTHRHVEADGALQPAALLPPETFRSAFRRTALAGAAIGGALGLAPVHAQEAERAVDLDTVEVVGHWIGENPKFTAPPVNTPRTVTTLDEGLMRERGAMSLQDVLRTTPGITLGAGEGGTPVGDRPFVRGYEASTDIFIDGVRDYARGSHDIFNLESIEIIKGASSAFTGRGGTGGSINLQTKRPRLDTFADVSAGYGSDGQWRATADGNLPVSRNGALRLNLMKMGGEVPGRDGVTVDRWGVAPSLAFGLETATRLVLQYSHVQNDDMPDLGIPFSNAARPERTTPPKLDRNKFYGRLNADFRENELKTSTILFEHDFSDSLSLRNVWRHVDTLNHYLMSRPTFDNCTAGSGPPCSDEGPDAQFSRASRPRWRATDSLINQTDLYGRFATGSVEHSYSVGLEVGRERIYNRSMSGAPATDIDSLYDPDPHRAYDHRIVYGDRTAAGQVRTRSLYFIETAQISERFLVNAGARRDIFEVEDTSDYRKDAFWNWQAGLIYKPASNGSLYLSYSTSSNPAGENLGQGGGADGVGGGAQIRDVDPEKSRSWELGTKWDLLGNRLSLTGALFQTEKTDARSTDPLTGDVTLDGNNRVRGVELGAAGAITDRWNLWAGYTWMDPEVIAYRSGNNVFDGLQMKFIARQSGSVWTTYQLLPALTVGGGATWQGDRYANDANTLVLPGWVRYDAMARYDVTRDFSLQLNVNNISDEEMYDASHVGLFAVVSPGRSWMLTATYRFD